jgi:hypothetical protein
MEFRSPRPAASCDSALHASSNTVLTFRQMSSKHLERTKLKLTLAHFERDLLQQLNPNAVRHLTDE